MEPTGVEYETMISIGTNCPGDDRPVLSMLRSARRVRAGSACVPGKLRVILDMPFRHVDVAP